MDEIIKLFINGKELEFDTDPKVVFTYQVTDVTNPTVVKNSFTKSVQVPGTPNNNDIFGHYWNIERYLNGGGEGGAYYNSSKKAPFQLFKGSTLYEEGYAKLDNIKRAGEQITYSLTLYGGLGDFFFQLSTNDDGNQKKLSDLDYTGSGVTEFDFTTNIDTVKEAWDALKNNTTGKWQYINFIPAYNGTPSDFDCDKMVIDTSGTSMPTKVAESDKGNTKWYTVKNDRWTLGTLPDEMTEWETHDLRSYLQRPCIRMKEIVNACCNPNNNGGYTVNLDPDFFNNDNPYWTDTWLTLPQVCNLEYNNTQQILEGASLITGDTTGETSGLMYQDLVFDLGEMGANIQDITVNAKITPYLRFPFTWTTSYVWFWNWNAPDYHSGWWCLGSLFVQLIAVNGDTVVGASDVYNLTTPIRHHGDLWYGHNGHYADSPGYDSSTGTRKMGNGCKYYPYMDKNIYNILGKFTSDGFVKEISHSGDESTYASTPYTFTFNINNIGSTVTGLKMVYYWGATADKIDKVWAPNKLMNTTQDSSWVFREHALDFRPIELNEHNITIVSHNLYAVVGESMGRTGTRVNKQLLLNTESSPCDYLLSYAKMYGLHFTKELGEKTINIMTRKTFYNGDDIVDLDELIDRSKEISIKPLMFESKWYQFIQEKDESEMQKKYLTAKGVEYGCKVLDTGYEFNSEKKDLLEDNCIKSGIEVLEKSKWFIAYNNDSALRPWMKLGLRYKLWNGADETDYLPDGWGDSGSILPINESQGLKYYDVFPKLQFHADGGDPTDGRDCLVFFSGFKDLVSGRTNPLSYILSDDNVWQTALNEGKPCYLFTNYEYIGDKRCCYKLQQLPVFERYLTSDNSGTIAKSLDFGSAQELFIPNYSLTDDTNIYHSFWRTYLTDLFDVNTKQMTCYVRIKDRPGVDWLRRFYWHDNAIWRVNKISDWNATSYETTKVEFIKVQDIANYTSVTQQKPSNVQLSANTYNVDYTGGTIRLYIYGVEPGVGWRMTKAGDATVTLSSTAGTGSGSITATFSGNGGDTLLDEYFTVTRDDNSASASIHVIQHYAGENNLAVSPNRLLLSRSGGTVDFTFTWFNQGGNYVTGATTSGTINVSSVDTATERLANKATVVFGSHSSTGVTHGTVTFNSTAEQAVVYVDQLISDYSFKGSGETKQLGTQYASGATVVEAPYWLKFNDTGDGNFDMTAELNPTATGRTGWVTMELNGVQSTFHVTQYVADEFFVDRLDGSGNVLAASGTTQMRVSSTSAWTGTSDVSWAVLGSSGASTSQTFNVNFDENTGATREATFTFTNAEGDTIVYKQTQSGLDGTGDSLVTPDVMIFPATGGTGVITVNIPNVWQIVSKAQWITTDISSGTTAATVNVTVPAYSGVDERTGPIVFFDTETTKSYTVTVIQQVGEGEILEVNPTVLTFPSSGGTILVSIISNTSWTIS